MTATLTRRTRRDLTRDQKQLLESELLQLAADLQPITVRGLYYQAVISAKLPFITKDHDGERTNYRYVQGRIADLRENGSIPWSWIVDESRPSYGVARFVSPAEYANTAPYWYNLDYWADQPCRPVLMVEKAGQIPVFLAHARSFGVDVIACKGYSSLSHLARSAESIGQYVERGQTIKVIVAHDFDPSGCDWPRAAKAAIHQRMAEVGLGPWKVEFQRELVTAEDAAAMSAAVALRAPNPKDARTAAWLYAYGFDADDECCVEMDAISPVEARRRMEAVYLGLFDGDLSDRRRLEQEHRQSIRTAVESLR